MHRAACLGFLACFSGSAAMAGEFSFGHEPPPAWLVFGGTSAGADHAAIYGGVIFAPAADLWQSGLRLRSASTAGFYRTGARQVRHTIAFASSAVLAGYQFAADGHSVAFYAGAEAVHFARADPPHHSAGWHFGARGLAEAHVDISEGTSAHGHVAYGTALRRVEASGKILRRVAGPWRAGPEAAFFDKLDGRDLRLGLALSRRGERSGLSASAGLSFGDGKDAAPYLTIGFDQSF